MERIRHPEKSPEDINRFYSITKDESNLQLVPAPFEWFGEYGPIDWKVYTLPESWRERQIISWFREYGIDYFKDLDIWDIDWDLSELREELPENSFIGSSGRTSARVEDLLRRMKSIGNSLVEIDGIKGSLVPGDVILLFEKGRNVPRGGTVVEIGSFAGLSAFVLARGLIASGNREARIYCVDLWESSVQVPEYRSLDFVRDNRMFEEFMANIERNGLSEFIIPVKGNSIEVAGRFQDESIDLLFVDGDHSFEGVYNDLQHWFPKVKPGGVIIGHDCVPGSGARRALELFVSKHALTYKVYEPPHAHFMFEIIKPCFHVEKNLVSLIILTLNNLEYTRQCLESIRRYTPQPHEIIVVDNGSTDGTVEFLQSQPDVRLIQSDENLGFALGNNRGLLEARGNYIVFLNNDVVVTEGWLARLIACAESNPRVGIVGPRSNYVAGYQLVRDVPYGEDMERMQEFAREWSHSHEGQWEDTARVIGFCMLVKREVIEAIGGFDPIFGLGNFEDDDFCIRAQIAGFKIKIAHDVFVHHFGSQTFRRENIDYRGLMLANWERFKAKWGLPRSLPLSQGYPIGTLIRRSFEKEKHRVPLEFTPYPLDGAKRVKYGAFFSPRVLSWYIQHFQVHDDVTLVLYKEEDSRRFLGEVSRVVQELGFHPEEVPDILLLCEPLDELKLASLLQAVNTVLVTPDTPPSWRRWAAYLGKKKEEIG